MNLKREFFEFGFFFLSYFLPNVVWKWAANKTTYRYLFIEWDKIYLKTDGKFAYQIQYSIQIQILNGTREIAKFSYHSCIRHF